jgi:hypothetical protein
VNATIKVPQIRAIQRIHFVARSPTSLTFGMIYPPCVLIWRITAANSPAAPDLQSHFAEQDRQQDQSATVNERRRARSGAVSC